MSKNEQKSEVQEPFYTKEQFLASHKFSGIQKDMLQALIDDGKRYTEKEVVQIIHTFLEGTVQ
ncbi:hypothetical protein HQN90_18220 [Paenibacillus alba]|uniref:hypothetical protein n=1 Tax=Paenibacillus alba TaxID=1197127 RepID=UPI001564CD42|nr:hypothetical protein [Paenibacillus alba]NQX68063.1 hypothetical protein [Paenibacillus alba]